MNIIEDVITNDIKEEQETPKYWGSTWGQMLLDATLEYPEFFCSKEAQSDDFVSVVFRRYYSFDISTSKIPNKTEKIVGLKKSWVKLVQGILSTSSAQYIEIDATLLKKIF